MREGLVVTFDGLPLSPARSQKVWNHSPAGFAWGYGGSGPAQLALAVLLELGLSNEAAIHHHQEYKRRVIAHLPMNQDFAVEVRWPL
jgi:hypothetical protein